VTNLRPRFDRRGASRNTRGRVCSPIPTAYFRLSAKRWLFAGWLVAWCGLLLGIQAARAADTFSERVYPGATWEVRRSEEVGLSREKLDALQELVGGRGCVVRHGFMAYSWGDQAKSSDLASAFKPLLSTLLFLAIQEGRIESVEAQVADFEPRLRTLNRGKDAAITWRDFAFQTSGYGLAEPPGQAYSYNDFALALYYDTLMQKVFQESGTQVLKTRLAEPLQFEDGATFEAFGPKDRPGRLALSVRDFARFGLLYLRLGRWRETELIKPEFVRMAVHSPLSPDTPLTSGRESEMLPSQRSIGGTRNITPVGPGFYSFNWWLNGTNQAGRRHFADAPPDTYVASGHGGKRTLWIIPSLDLIVCWNDSKIDDHDKSPEDANTKMNQAARLITAAVMDRPGLDNLRREPSRPTTILGVQGAQFTVNRQPTFLYGISYYGALGASEEFIQKDLTDMRRFGFNWIRVWANWGAFSNNVAVVDEQGAARPAYLDKLKWLVAECDRQGLVVDVSLSRGNGVSGPPRLQSIEAHQRAVETIAAALKPFQNWYLDLGNERNIRDKRFTPMDHLKTLRERVRQLDPHRLVTASHAGDITREDLREYLETVTMDFISPHRPRNAASPSQTEAKSREYLSRMKEMDRLVPLHYQEPIRRGFGQWQPAAQDFITDARGAKAAGAAGWCFHNGDERDRLDGEPRRSFDLRQRRLFDQLDEVERKAIDALKGLLGP
jgi:CubicO group peptidase (beta-lactamase class C family)